MIVRPASPRDVPAVAGLEAESLGADAWSYGLVAEGVEGNLPTVAYLVAETDARVVGHAVASVAGDLAELQRIAVTPGARRGGVGAALLAAVVDRARAGGADRILLEVREDNATALSFYVASGFAEVDRRRRYYRDGADALVLQRTLTGRPPPSQAFGPCA